MNKRDLSPKEGREEEDVLCGGLNHGEDVEKAEFVGAPKRLLSFTNGLASKFARTVRSGEVTYGAIAPSPASKIPLRAELSK